MGLIRAAVQSAASVMADQWEEYFYCDSIPANILAVKGSKKTSRRGSNKKGSDNVISNGSVIAVNEGQCMMIVDQGRVVDICAQPGEYIYDTSSEPSVFYGDLGENIRRSFENFGIRFAFGGEAPKDQRVYYINTKEIVGNKYGTANPVPFRVVDRNIELDIDIAIRCHGEYSYRVVDPICFYVNVCGNVEGAYSRENLDSQLKSELMTALQPAFARISDMGIRYSSLPGHTQEIAAALNQVLSEKWVKLRGIALASFGVSSVKASEEDEDMIKQLQKAAVLRDPNMAAATITGAQADAMKTAAGNKAAGPMMAFAGMNMAANAGGINAGQLFEMGQQNRQNNAAPQTGTGTAPQAGAGMSQAAGGWTCSCGAQGNTGRFCAECGKPKPSDNGWTCSCGAVNKGKFCTECGKPRPAGAKLYRCDKCGWEPEDPAHPPKFCPECGDRFDDGDVK
ncbi:MULTISPECIES: SPFH domain-containing protein [Eisenbergiella]|uniref:SPFH domain-containing protein n=1 Tax=Eisenbergiella TaxID=1432051 RepID=UPI0023F2F43B|nr:MULTISPECIES: SPFH domain-containing protein [Eisenbergiella]MDY2652785.1 SPFH domain-containing protein [Eisenbergiella porci]